MLVMPLRTAATATEVCGVNGGHLTIHSSNELSRKSYQCCFAEGRVDNDQICS